VLHSYRGRALTLRFAPGGEVRYTDNCWLWGVGDVTIEANGTGFRCTSPSVWSADSRPFNVKTPFHVLGPVSRAEEQEWGNPFTVGELLTEADLADYEGQRVLVYGYDTQQGGFPPNPRFFHYATVRSGALDPALPWTLDDRWPDFEQPTGLIGRPRILRLERPGQYVQPRRLVFRNARFLVGHLTGATTLAADYLEFVDCEADYVTFQFAKEARMTRVRARIWEPDKFIGTLLMQDCDATEEFGGATGVLTMMARGCSFTGDCRGSGPDMTFEGCTFRGEAVSDWGIWRFIEGRAIPRLLFRDCTFDASASPNLRHAINPGPDNSQPGLLPMIEVLEVLRGGDIAVRPVGPFAGQPNKIWGDIAAGQPLMDGAGAVKGHVLGLYSDGRPVVRVNWLEPPAVGTMYQFWLIFGRFDGGGNVVIGRDVPLWRGKFESSRSRGSPVRRTDLPARRCRTRSANHTVLRPEPHSNPT
jgi:hypothetical protein